MAVAKQTSFPLSANGELIKLDRTTEEEVENGKERSESHPKRKLFFFSPLTIFYSVLCLIFTIKLR